MVIKLARFLSVVLGPQVWLPALFFLIIFRSGLNKPQLSLLLPLVFLLEVAIPLGYLFIAPKVGWATSWELPKRSERYPIFIITVVTSLASLTLIYFVGTKLLFDLSLLFLLMLIVSMAITFYWQISLHVTLNVFGALIANFLFNWSLPMLYVVIPMVMWSRYFLKRHTASQLVVPIILNSGIVFVGLYYLGYL
jgi:hypothetical protein